MFGRLLWFRFDQNRAFEPDLVLVLGDEGQEDCAIWSVPVTDEDMGESLDKADDILNDSDSAMKLYEQILLEHKSSIYIAESYL